MTDRTTSTSSGPPDPDRFGGWLREFARLTFRFLCAAWFVGAIEIVRRGTGLAGGLDRRTSGAVLALASMAALGIVILWRSRASPVREVLELSAMIGLWTGMVALLP
ncbi:MAG: hypothetical protein ABI914_02345 [Acidobacteriota bacterium]